MYEPAPDGRHPTLATHAANPLPVHLQGDVYRVFYSGRDAQNRSSVGAVDIDIVCAKVVCDHPEPFFLHGAPGTFYEAGVSIGNCYRASGRDYMLFMGWQNPPGGHWRGDIGRLLLEGASSLRLDPHVPFMGSDAEDAISLSYPWVLRREDGTYDMWYGSTTAWDGGNGEMVHVIKHASSTDGERWQRMGLAVPYRIGVVQAFSRPTVVRNPGGSLDMWFSYRSGTGTTYRIGYAHSADGIGWTLDLACAGIDVSSDGWDSEMIEYPFVMEHAGERYMLYNGNGYGRTGFGLAVWAR